MSNIEIVDKNTGVVEVADADSLAYALQLVKQNQFEDVARIDSEIVSLKPSESVEGVFAGVVELDGQWGKYEAVRLLRNRSGVPEFVLLPGVQLVGQVKVLNLVLNRTPIRIEGLESVRGENGTYIRYAIYLLKGVEK